MIDKKDAADLLQMLNVIQIQGSQAERIVELKRKLVGIIDVQN